MVKLLDAVESKAGKELDKLVKSRNKALDKNAKKLDKYTKKEDSISSIVVNALGSLLKDSQSLCIDSVWGYTRAMSTALWVVKEHIKVAEDNKDDDEDDE